MLIKVKTLTGKGEFISASCTKSFRCPVQEVLNTFLLASSAAHVGRVEIELDIEQTDKIQRIKERVEEKEGIPPAQQRLIFGGKQMYVPPLNLL